MPELPEVETVRAGLGELLRERPRILFVKLMREDIRFPIPKDLPNRLAGQPVIGVRRRAKYLLIETPKVILLSHLGMTGSWRILEKGDSLVRLYHESAKATRGTVITPSSKGPSDPHDHAFIGLSDGRTLVFRDPRRFGMLDLIEPGHEAEHPRLKGLGPEPLDEAAFSQDYLFRRSRKRKVAVKVFIMDQKIVVGVGNIYASEALFRAKIRPSRLAARLTLEDCARLVREIRVVLKEAIVAGGSSIRDYRQAGGDEGAFQKSFRVYDREGEPCSVCGTLIRAKVMGGRNTFWCPHCQK